jgi:hypothetical protein
MRNLRFGRPSPAMVVASIALLVALGGTAIAAKKIGSGQIKKNAVKTKKIANQAVTKGKLADGAVSSAKLVDGAVESSSIAQDAVATGKIQSNAVTQGKLADDSVGTAQLLPDSVGTNKLRANAVTGDKVLNGSLGLSKISQVIADATLPGGNMLGAGACQLSDAVTVSGLQNADYVLVIARTDNWDPQLVLDGYEPGPDPDEVRFRVCNIAGVMITTDDVTVRILGFG